MQENVQPVETAILLVCIWYDVMMGAGMEFGGFFPVLDKTAEHPEQCVNPECCEGCDQQAGHGNKSVEQDRIFVSIGHLTMCVKLGEENSRLGVALGAGPYQIRLVNAGGGIGHRQNRVSRVAVSAARDFFREAKTVILAMVAFHVRFNGYIEYLVAVHHFLVAMAFHADLGMKFTFRVRTLDAERLDVVEVVAVSASSRVHVSGSNGFSVDRLLINGFFVVALNTFRYSYSFVILPVGVCVDIGMTVCTHDAFGSMYAGIMLRILLLVAAFALNFLNLNLFSHMLGEIGDVNVATGTGVFAMHGVCKCPHGDLVAVTAKAGGGVNGHALFCSSREGNCE